MTRIALGAAFGIVVGIIAGAALSIHADQEPSEDTVAAATEAGVDATDLQGAVNTTGLDPVSYLVAVGELALPEHSSTTGVVSAGSRAPLPDPTPGWLTRVRLTFYTEYGVTYGGGHPYSGSTACSWNFALGTRFRLPDGEVFACNDRGLLGSSGWLDLWRRADLAHRYGPWAAVEVLP